MRLIHRALVFTLVGPAIVYFLVTQQARVGRGRGGPISPYATAVSRAGGKGDGAYENEKGVDVTWRGDDQVVFKESRFNFIDPFDVEQPDDGEKHGQAYENWPWEPCDQDEEGQWCRNSYDGLINEIQVVVKTSHFDDPARFTVQLNTTLSKIPHENIVLFSDRKDVLDNGFETINVFETIPQAELEKIPEYGLYQQLQRGEMTGQVGTGYNALDKYKHVPMKKAIWKMQGEKPKKWFVFIETDTYIHWDNLLFFLHHYDSAKDLYFGNVVYSDGGEYANSTAGYVLSHEAMQRFHADDFINDGWYQYPSQHGFNTSSQEHGEVAVAQILRQKETYLRGFTPMFNDKSAFTYGFNENSWCDVVLTLHGGETEEMQKAHDYIEWWKNDTGNDRPLIYKDLFNLISEQLPLTKSAWRAFDPNPKLLADWHADHFDNIDQCRQYCQSHRKCMQFELYNGTCAYSYEISLGKKADDDVVSGWKKGRLNAWAKKHQCKAPHWAHQFPPWLGDQGYKAEYTHD